LPDWQIAASRQRAFRWISHQRQPALAVLDGRGKPKPREGINNPIGAESCFESVRRRTWTSVPFRFLLARTGTENRKSRLGQLQLQVFTCCMMKTPTCLSYFSACCTMKTPTCLSYFSADTSDVEWSWAHDLTTASLFLPTLIFLQVVQGGICGVVARWIGIASQGIRSWEGISVFC
jgi:hypothetical protein